MLRLEHPPLFSITTIPKLLLSGAILALSIIYLSGYVVVGWLIVYNYCVVSYRRLFILSAVINIWNVKEENYKNIHQNDYR